jgi:MoxR-like ATPase
MAQSGDDKNAKSALEQYGVNLTDIAREGKLDPVIGRDQEIRRVSQVLTRRTKNNPVLIGEPGVGKTAVVEGLAQRIVASALPFHRPLFCLRRTPLQRLQHHRRSLRLGRAIRKVPLLALRPLQPRLL